MTFMSLLAGERRTGATLAVELVRAVGTPRLARPSVERSGVGAPAYAAVRLG